MPCRNPRRKREKEVEKICKEIMAKNVPKLRKEMNIHVPESQQTPSRINSKKTPLRQIRVKLSKPKERSLKAGREGTSHIPRILNKINSWFILRYHRSQKTVEWHILNSKIKSPASLEFCICQNQLS